MDKEAEQSPGNGGAAITGAAGIATASIMTPAQTQGQLQQLPGQPVHQSHFAQPAAHLSPPLHVPHPQQAQQQSTVTLQPGVWSQQMQQQHDQTPTTWPYAQQLSAPVGNVQPTTQHMTPTLPIAIPNVPAAAHQQHGQAQPSTSSPSSAISSQPTHLMQQNSLISSTGTGSAHPDSLPQLHLAPSVGGQETPSCGIASSIQRELAMASAVATAGMDAAGSTAPLSLLGAVPQTQQQRSSGSGVSGISPRASHMYTLAGITPQASAQLSQMSRAASLTVTAAAAGSQGQAAGVSKLRPQGRKGTVDSDDTDYSSSDNDDDYEYGEARVKRTFTRQQRKQRKQQREEQKQQQLQLAAQRSHEQSLQAAQQSLTGQGLQSTPVSPQKHGLSEDGSAVSSSVIHPGSSVSAQSALAATLSSSPQPPLPPVVAQAALQAAVQKLAAVQRVAGTAGGSFTTNSTGTPAAQQGPVAAGGPISAASAVGDSPGAIAVPTAGLLTTALQDGAHNLEQQSAQPAATMASLHAEHAAAATAACGPDGVAPTPRSTTGGSAAAAACGPGSVQGDAAGEASFKDRLHGGQQCGDADRSKGDSQTTPSELQAEFQGLSLFDDADDEDESDHDERECRPWFKRPMVWFHLVAFFLSACLLFVGLGSQFIPAMFVVNKDGIELFRWMYFFALWPMLWVTVNFVNNKVFAFVEWLYYLEALYALDSVRRNARSLVFMCLVLPWFHICFWVVRCEGGCNEQQAYRQASGVVWKILVCLTLFSLANFLKSLTTKLLSTHFYRTAHFKKVKLAIEKEYYLLMLSQQRPQKPLEVDPLGALTQLVTAGGHAGSVVANGGLQVVDKLRRITVGDTETNNGLADLKKKTRPSSFSGTELEHSNQKLPSLAAKSACQLRAYGRSEPVSITASANTTAAAAPTAGSDHHHLGLSPVSEGRLDVVSTRSGEVSVKTSSSRVLRLETSSGSGGQQNTDNAGRRWFWWRPRGSQTESLLGADGTRSSEYTIAIAASPPKDASHPHPQQTMSNGVVAPAAAVGPGDLMSATPGSPAVTTQSTTAAASAFAPAAQAAAAPQVSPRASMDSKAAAAGGGGGGGGGGGVHRVSAGGKGPCHSGLTKSPSLAAPRDVVADPLLHTLEKVNVLGGKGKQVDAATMKPAEWERLRTGIALKTFTALMKRYQDMSEQEEARKLREARRFAKGLFYNVKGDAPRPFLIRDDFAPFFPNKDQADQAFAYFDKDNDAQLTIKEMKDSVTAIFKERKNMAASLKDTDSIVKTLEFGIGFVFHFIFAAVYLLVWGLDILKGFSTFSATVLALTFVFGNSVRNIYESMLFLFVEHAFDVGDLLEVEAVSYRVKKIDLMYTVLVKGTGERVYYPTTRLITLPVTNLTRTSTKSEKVVFNLDIGAASTQAREALTECVKDHYEENESDFNTCPSVNFVNLVDPFKVQLQVMWTYNFGADEYKRMSNAKTSLLTAINDCLASLDCLQYTLVRDSDVKAGGKAAEQVQGMLENGQMQLTATGVPAATGVNTSAATVVGAAGALGVLSM